MAPRPSVWRVRVRIQRSASRMAAAANPLAAALLPHFEDAVQLMEQHAESPALGQRQAHVRQQQLIQVEPRRSAPVRTAGLHDGERHQNRPRPRGHFVEHVARQHDDLGRHRRRVFARIQPEQAEVDLDVAVGRLQAAQRQNALPGGAHGIALRRNAGQLQRAIRLDGRADFRGTAGINVEAAIRHLPVQNRPGRPVDALPGGRIPTGFVRLIEPELKQNIIGFQRGVGGQFAAPEALRRLLRGEGIHRAPHGTRDFLPRKMRRRFGHMAAAWPRGFGPFVRHR